MATPENQPANDWLRQKQKGETMLTATNKALRKVGHLLSREEFKEIEKLTGDVAVALEKESLNELIAAISALDEGTIHLADLLIYSHFS
jgi:uncharacterized protein (DUF2336 family)